MPTDVVIALRGNGGRSRSPSAPRCLLTGPRGCAAGVPGPGGAKGPDQHRGGSDVDVSQTAIGCGIPVGVGTAAPWARGCPDGALPLGGAVQGWSMHDAVTVHMAAPPDKVWELVSDVTKIGRYSPETFEAEWLDGATGPAVGAKFRGHVKRNGRGPVYWTTCTVTATRPAGSSPSGLAQRQAPQRLALSAGARG